ncbi:prolyl oligopeptidase family protein [Euzebya sp.]|uniref:prolyl oligopeptidase family serine peptidase n=1 Tax=Euzebya sp. TaxID=1971409 RepID=UPI0035131426
MDHPATRRDELVETLHGHDVADPYRWLEDQTADDVAEWVAAQGAHTEAWLAERPHRDAIRERLAEIWDHPKVSLPWRRGDRWFQSRNSGLQEQAVLHVADDPTGEGRVLLDPHELSDDGTVSLAATSISRDGRLLAYGTSDGGSDWITWRVRDVATGTDTGDVAEWGKVSGAAWTEDASGFFYGGYDPPAPGHALDGKNTDHELRFHRLGADEPVLVHARPDHPTWGFGPAITEDGRWLVVTVWEGTQPTNRIHLGDLTGTDDPAAVEITPWLDTGDAEYDVIGNDGDTMFVQTDLGAPNGRLLAISAADPTDRREVLPATDHALLAVRYVGGRLLALRMVDAVHQLTVHAVDGSIVTTVDLPDSASVGGITGRQEDTVVHLSLSSFTQSMSIARLDVTDPVRLTEVRAPAIRLDDVVTEQTFVDSTDGARVPLFLIHRRDAPIDGSNRTLLYGYGGFDISLTPEFRLWWSVWLERGGVVAVGCFRGGGEYGRDWHDAGRLANKPHTFDDALACARWLVDAGWCRPGNLAITGGSNGGLTAAATMLRDPSAFGACVPEVGVLDLLRFHRFTIGWGWTSDYGDPDDPDDFAWIRPMSPYHAVLDRPGEYPATLITTADRDDRVVPAHSFKFTAALQAAQTGPAPILARIDTRAGHGAGTPTSKLIDARTDVVTFLEEVLGGEGS